MTTRDIIKAVGLLDSSSKEALELQANLCEAIGIPSALLIAKEARRKIREMERGER